jgi:hypothetical protein
LLEASEQVIPETGSCSRLEGGFGSGCDSASKIPGSFNPFRVLPSRDTDDSEGVIKSELDLTSLEPILFPKLRIYLLSTLFYQLEAFHLSPWRPAAVMSTTWRKSFFFKRIFKARRQRTKRRKSAALLFLSASHIRKRPVATITPSWILSTSRCLRQATQNVSKPSGSTLPSSFEATRTTLQQSSLSLSLTIPLQKEIFDSSC